MARVFSAGARITAAGVVALIPAGLGAFFLGIAQSETRGPDSIWGNLWTWLALSCWIVATAVIVVGLRSWKRGQPEPRLRFERLEVIPAMFWLDPGPEFITDPYPGGTSTVSTVTVINPGATQAEAFYVARAHVVNDDGAPVHAENIQVSLEFSDVGGGSQPVFIPRARWSALAQPSSQPLSASLAALETWPRLNPGQPSIIDVAAKYPDDRVGYAYGNDSYIPSRTEQRADVRHEPYRLAGESVRVKAKITADNLIKPHEEWFLLSGLDEQGPLRFTRLVEDGTQAG